MTYKLEKQNLKIMRDNINYRVQKNFTDGGKESFTIVLWLKSYYWQKSTSKIEIKDVVLSLFKL